MTFHQRTNRGLATAMLITVLCTPNAHSQDLVDSALRFFIGDDSNTTGLDLDKARPQPAPPDFRARVIETLPKEDRITKLKEPQRQKLDSLGIVLRLHERQTVYEFAIYESAPKPFAFIGLHQRAVLLISDIALNLLTAAELQAAVAHEIGHEYVWAEYLEAARRNDDRRLKELELICDGVGILTMRRVGVEPNALVTATEKIARFNISSTGPSTNAHRYPSDDDRRRFTQAIIARAASLLGGPAFNRRTER